MKVTFFFDWNLADVNFNDQILFFLGVLSSINRIIGKNSRIGILVKHGYNINIILLSLILKYYSVSGL